jgi:hypothetical protein
MNTDDLDFILESKESVAPLLKVAMSKELQTAARRVRAMLNHTSLAQSTYRTDLHGVDPTYVVSVQRHGFKGAWRANTVSWYLEVGTKLHLPLEVSERAVHYMDRYLSVHSVDGPQFKLVAAAALLISVKIDSQLAMLNTRKLVKLTQNMFTAIKDLVRMEAELLHTLGFSVNPPTATEAAALFVDVLKHDPSTSTSVSAHTRALLAAAPEFGESVREAIGLCLPRLEFLPFSKVELAWAAIRYALAKHGEGAGANADAGMLAVDELLAVVSEGLVGEVNTADEDEDNGDSLPSTTVDACKAVVAEVLLQDALSSGHECGLASRPAVALSYTTALEVRCFELMLTAA